MKLENSNAIESWKNGFFLAMNLQNHMKIIVYLSPKGEK
jgi:hypothetical protein